MIGHTTLRRSLLLVAAAALSLGGCRLHVPGPLAPNHAPEGFRLARPGCEPAPRPSPSAEDRLLVQYLGVSGLYLEWQGEALLFSPFFSRPSVAELARKTWKPDEASIREALAPLPLEKIRAVLIGHGHYDHLGDIPFIAAQLLPEARILTNRTGAHQLAPYPELRGRVADLEPELGRWTTLGDGDGEPLPFRVMALATTHAPQLGSLRWATGETTVPWQHSWDHKKAAELRQGRPLAFLLDLLDPETGSTRYRLYVNEAASDAGSGLPPEGTLDERSVDVAFLCMASAHLAAGYPERLLAELGARYLVVDHYDDFFRPYTSPPRLVPGLTPGRARAFLRRADSTLRAAASAGQPPATELCGPRGPRLSMPLPGEWMAFPVGEGEKVGR